MMVHIPVLEDTPNYRTMSSREWVFYVDEASEYEGEHDQEYYFSFWLEDCDRDERFPLYCDIPFGGWFSQDDDFDDSDERRRPTEYFWKALWWYLIDDFTDEHIDELDENSPMWEEHIVSGVVDCIGDGVLSTEMKVLFHDAIEKEGDREQFEKMMENENVTGKYGDKQ